MLETKQGALIDVLISPSRTRDDGGNEVFVATVKDISSRKLAERKLVQYEKFESLGALASGIAHDLNNLLTPVLGFADLAAESDDPKTMREALQTITEASCKARALIMQIHQFSGTRSEAPEPVRLGPLINDALKLVRASLGANVTLETRIDAVDDVVQADSAKVQQLVLNLCSNAGYAMRDQVGTLLVQLRDAGSGHLRLLVADTGPGMTRDVKARIFEPYFTTKSKPEGTGLGLAIVQRIVVDMGGLVSVRSQPGQGTCFEITLPLAREQPAGTPLAAKPVLPADAGALSRVLLIDDEPAVLDFAESALRTRGLEPTICGSPSEALALLRSARDRVDVICVDHSMPEMTGLEFLAAVRESGCTHPAVLMSGHMADISDRQKADLGIVASLAKPFTADELCATLAYG